VLLSIIYVCGAVVGTHRQLQPAGGRGGPVGGAGHTFVPGLPPQLYLGIDYTAHLLDPDGHLICLYYYMEQVGWDGKPRPQSQRRTAAVPWPETLQLLSDTYADQTYMGPLG